MAATRGGGRGSRGSDEEGGTRKHKRRANAKEVRTSPGTEGALTPSSHTSRTTFFPPSRLPSSSSRPPPLPAPTSGDLPLLDLLLQTDRAVRPQVYTSGLPLSTACDSRECPPVARSLDLKPRTPRCRPLAARRPLARRRPLLVALSHVVALSSSPSRVSSPSLSRGLAVALSRLVALHLRPQQSRATPGIHLESAALNRVR